MHSFFLATIGGVLIAIASSIILFGLGRIAGISGIFSSFIFNSKSFENRWKFFFVVGLLVGGFLIKYLNPSLFDYSINFSMPLVIFAGLLVGFGTRLGSGCTSGHGVCGLPRLSKRSFIATITFIGFGILTVLLKGLL
jgi:uncharacterized membrane protein YedE/YeeE